MSPIKKGRIIVNMAHQKGFYFFKVFSLDEKNRREHKPGNGYVDYVAVTVARQVSRKKHVTGNRAAGKIQFQ